MWPLPTPLCGFLCLWMQDLSSFGYWNLRAAMLNCLPVTMSKSPEHERNIFNTHEHGHESSNSATAQTAAAGAEQDAATQREADAVKGAPDTPGKQQQQQQQPGGHPLTGFSVVVYVGIPHVASPASEQWF